MIRGHHVEFHGLAGAKTYQGPVDSPFCLRRQLAQAQEKLAEWKLVFGPGLMGRLAQTPEDAKAMLKEMSDLAVSESAAEQEKLSAQQAIIDRRTKRLNAIMPLFQEARDAICAISLTEAKLRGIDLTLANRMDDVGIQERWDAAEARKEKGKMKCHTEKGVFIPGCMGAAAMGRDHCTCDAGHNSFADNLVRLTKRVERLERIIKKDAAEKARKQNVQTIADATEAEWKEQVNG